MPVLINRWMPGALSGAGESGGLAYRGCNQCASVWPIVTMRIT